MRKSKSKGRRLKSKGRKSRSISRSKKSKSNKYALGKFRSKKNFFGRVVKNQTQHAYSFIQATANQMRMKKRKGFPKDKFEGMNLIADYMKLRDLLGSNDRMLQSFFDAIVSYFATKGKDNGAQNLMSYLTYMTAQAGGKVPKIIRKKLEVKIGKSKALTTGVRALQSHFYERDPEKARRILRCEKLLKERDKIKDEGLKTLKKCKAIRAAKTRGVHLRFSEQLFANKCLGEVRSLLEKANEKTREYEAQKCGIDPVVTQRIYERASEELKESAENEAERRKVESNLNQCQIFDNKRQELSTRILHIVELFKKREQTQAELTRFIGALKEAIDLMETVHHKKLEITHLCPSLERTNNDWDGKIKDYNRLLRGYQDQLRRMKQPQAKALRTPLPHPQSRPLQTNDQLRARLDALTDRDPPSQPPSRSSPPTLSPRPPPPIRVPISPSILSLPMAPSPSTVPSTSRPGSPVGSVASEGTIDLESLQAEADAMQTPNLTDTIHASQRQLQDTLERTERLSSQMRRRPSGGYTGGIRRSKSTLT